MILRARLADGQPPLFFLVADGLAAAPHEPAYRSGKIRDLDQKAGGLTLGQYAHLAVFYPHLAVVALPELASTLAAATSLSRAAVPEDMNGRVSGSDIAGPIGTGVDVAHECGVRGRHADHDRCRLDLLTKRINIIFVVAVMFGVDQVAVSGMVPGDSPAGQVGIGTMPLHGTMVALLHDYSVMVAPLEP
jgi:hypothetical protein